MLSSALTTTLFSTLGPGRTNATPPRFWRRLPETAGFAGTAGRMRRRGFRSPPRGLDLHRGIVYACPGVALPAPGRWQYIPLGARLGDLGFPRARSVRRCDFLDARSIFFLWIGQIAAKGAKP